MNKFEKFIVSLSFTSVCLLFALHYETSEKIENLNKQIELLECYKENYLIMADSLDGIHNACFKIRK